MIGNLKMTLIVRLLFLRPYFHISSNEIKPSSGQYESGKLTIKSVITRLLLIVFSIQDFNNKCIANQNVFSAKHIMDTQRGYLTVVNNKDSSNAYNTNFNTHLASLNLDPESENNKV